MGMTMHNFDLFKTYTGQYREVCLQVGSMFFSGEDIFNADLSTLNSRINSWSYKKFSEFSDYVNGRIVADSFYFLDLDEHMKRGGRMFQTQFTELGRMINLLKNSVIQKQFLDIMGKEFSIETQQLKAEMFEKIKTCKISFLTNIISSGWKPQSDKNLAMVWEKFSGVYKDKKFITFTDLQNLGDANTWKILDLYVSEKIRTIKATDFENLGQALLALEQSQNGSGELNPGLVEVIWKMFNNRINH